MLNTKSARRALADSTLALIAACAAIAMFLPPMLTATVASVPRTVAVALVVALALPLHWILLGIAANRMGRSVGTWVGGAVLLFPVGGAAALILLSWLLDEEPQGLPAASH
jgi:predicted ABC-type exoprotein transport system permease subunit